MNCTFAKWWDNEPGGRGGGGGGFWYSKSKAACAQVGRDYSLILVKKNCCSLALCWWSFLSSYTVCKYLFKKSKISPFKFYIIFFLLPLLTSDSTFRFIQYWYIIFATTVQCVIRYTNFDLWILLNNHWIKYSFTQFHPYLNISNLLFPGLSEAEPLLPGLGQGQVSLTPGLRLSAAQKN